jgi:tRNA G18 (ribose-2'-O)-methylase SpoU
MAYQLSTDKRPRELSFFRSLKGKGGHLDEGIYIVENPKIVEKVLASNAEVASAYMTAEYLAQYATQLERRDGVTTTVIVGNKQDMESIVGYDLHQGVMLAVRIPSTLEDPYSPEPLSMTVALDSIADAENMGALIRNAAAFHADALVADAQSCHPYLRRSVRVSMGTIVDVDVRRVASLPDFLFSMKSQGSRIVGAALGEHSTPLNECDLTGNLTLVFGAEGRGLRREVIQACDELLEIPMSLDVDSLNVAVANGIVLNRAMEQRKK